MRCRRTRSTVSPSMPPAPWPARRRRWRASSRARRLSRMRLPAMRRAVRQRCALHAPDEQCHRGAQGARAAHRLPPAAAHDTAGLVPRLTAEAGALAASLPPATASAATAPSSASRRAPSGCSWMSARSARAPPTRAGRAAHRRGQRVSRPGDRRLCRRQLRAGAAAPDDAGRREAPEDARLDLQRARRGGEARGGRSSRAACGAERRARHRRDARELAASARGRSPRREGAGMLEWLPLVLLAGGPGIAARGAARGAAPASHARAAAPLGGGAA